MMTMTPTEKLICDELASLRAQVRWLTIAVAVLAGATGVDLSGLV